MEMLTSYDDLDDIEFLQPQIGNFIPNMGIKK